MQLQSDLGNRVTVVTYNGETVSVKPAHNPFMKLPFRSLFAAIIFSQLPQLSARSVKAKGDQSNIMESGVVYFPDKHEYIDGAGVVATVNYNVNASEQAHTEQSYRSMSFYHHRLQFQMQMQTRIL